MQRRHLLTCAIALATTTSQHGRAAPPERPPPLTFEKHVDYVGWYRKQTEKPGKVNAFDALTKLLDATNPENNLPFKEYQEETLRYPFDDLAKGGIVWNPNDLPNVEAYVVKIEEKIRAFERTTVIADYWRTIPAASPRLRGDKPRDGSHSRHAIRAIQVRGWRKSSNMSEQLTKAHSSIAGHCRQLRQSMDLLNWLLYCSYVSSLSSSIRAALHERLLTPEAIQRTSESLLEWNSSSMRFDGMLCLDWAEQLDMLQNTFPDAKYDRKNYKKMAEIYGKSSIPERRADPHAVLAKVNETYDQLITIAAGPISRKTWRKAEEHLERVHGKRELPDFKYPGVLASFGRGYLLHLEAETEWRGTLLALAVHQHYLKEKQWPARLSELKIPEFKWLRTDPFSGRDFMYRVEDGQPVLYSVAVDGIDDNATHTGRWEGILDKGVDFVFLPYHEPVRFHFKERNPKTDE